MGIFQQQADSSSIRSIGIAIAIAMLVLFAIFIFLVVAAIVVGLVVDRALHLRAVTQPGTPERHGAAGNALPASPTSSKV
jgi:hypothetical protein